METVTLGDLLDRARDHLHACARVPDNPLRGDTAAETARMTGRLALTLSRYLGDFAPYEMAQAIYGAGLDAQARAAVDGREALRLAAVSLGSSAPDRGDPVARAADPRVAHLEAAATALAAGRDLLQTHFATSADGVPLPASDWAVVIRCTAVTRALLGETARWSQQLGLLTARLAAAAAADPAIPVAVSQRLADGCRGLLTASLALTAARAGETGTDAELLYAIPAGFPPERQVPKETETATELATGVAASAARLRVIAPAAARRAEWSPAMTADSWRWTATGAAVVYSVSEIMLRTLAEQPGPLAGPEAMSTGQGSAELLRAADAASDACGRWRGVAAGWKEMSTDTRGLTSPVVADTGDLVVRLGRLAFADPVWTPVRSRSAPVRGIEDLAPDSRQAAVVVGAIHHAADALACAAVADVRAVDAAIRASRIHVPTRTLPESDAVRYRYWNLPPAHAAGLLDAYKVAVAASDRLVREMDTVAVMLNAPSRIRAVARAGVRADREAGAVRAASDRADGSGSVSRAEPEVTEVGSVEQAVRRAGSADLIVLMRARAMDSGVRKLIAEARGSAAQAADASSESNSKTLRPTELTPARLAGVSFPPKTIDSAELRSAAHAVAEGRRSCAARLPATSRGSSPGT